MFKRNDNNDVTSDVFMLFLKNHGEDLEKYKNAADMKCEKCGCWRWNCRCQTGAPGPMGSTGATGPRGPRGADGAVGEMGPCGTAGATGATGAQGYMGAKGYTGPQGDTGPQGIKGETGPRGEKGETGLTGERGADGLRGAKGPKGETGLEGAAFVCEYGYFWNTAVPVADIVLEQNIPFADGATHSPTINYDPLTKEIAVDIEGFYEVEFAVAAKNANQVTLFLDGSAVLGGTYGINTNNGVNYGKVILKVPSKGRLSLKNHVTAQAEGNITLRTNPGGSSGEILATNASILIKKIG